MSPSTDWGRLDSQPHLTAQEIKAFSTNVANGLDLQMGGAVNMAYCMRCRHKEEVTNARMKMSSNSRMMMQGNCKSCNGKVSAIMKKQ